MSHEISHANRKWSVINASHAVPLKIVMINFLLFIHFQSHAKITLGKSINRLHDNGTKGISLSSSCANFLYIDWLYSSDNILTYCKNVIYT